MSKSILPIFSSRSSLVLALSFNYLIHFEFVFVYDVRKQYSLILLHVAVQFSQPHLLKRLYFPQVIFLPPCSRLIDHVSMDINLGSLFYSIDLFLCQCHTYYLKSRSLITQVFVLSQDCLAIWSLLCFHKKFRLLFQFCEKCY